MGSQNYTLLYLICMVCNVVWHNRDEDKIGFGLEWTELSLVPVHYAITTSDCKTFLCMQPRLILHSSSHTSRCNWHLESINNKQ